MNEFKLKHVPERVVMENPVTQKFLEENGMGTDAEFNEESLLVPTKFSLKDYMSPTRDQGGAGTCTSFGVLSNLEFLHGKRDLSEACITHDAEKRYGDCKAGLATVHAYLIGRDKGVVDESVWPYDDDKICWNPAPNTSGKHRYKFNNIKRVFYRPTKSILENMVLGMKGDYTKIESATPRNFVKLLKAALVTHRAPVTISVPVWWKSDGHFDAGWEWGPNINMPTLANLKTWLETNNVSLDNSINLEEGALTPPNVSGWHAISICGYDNTTGRFEFKNSWNSWWGNGGYGTLPYKYVTAFSRGGYIGF